MKTKNIYYKLLVYILSIITLFSGVNSFFTKDVKAATATPPNFKVAFISDTGSSNYSRLIDLLKAEGANMVVDLGDFEWGTSGQSKVTSTFGSNILYVGAKGNHDSWSAPATFFQQRISASGATVLDPLSSTDLEYALKYNGLTIAVLGDGDSSRWSGYASFLNTQLPKTDSIWKICAFHRGGVRNDDTWVAGRSMMGVGEKPQEMGVQVYEACRQQGAFTVSGHVHVYSRSKTITKYEDYSASNSTKNGIVVNTSVPANQLVVKPGSTFSMVVNSSGHSVRDYNCDFHDAEENGSANPWYKGDWWWDAIYAKNMYMRGGSVVKKDCTRTGTSTYGHTYDTNIYPTGGINNHTFSATYITFNVDGNPKKATGYTKNFDGQIVDSFTIYADSTAPVNTPTSTPLITSTPTPLRTATATPVRTSTPTGVRTATPTSVAGVLQGDLDNDGDVDSDDYNLLVTKFNNPYTIYDYNKVITNFGKTTGTGQTFSSVADTYVSSSNTTINYGGATTAIASNFSSTDLRTAYLKFNVGTTSIQSAQLKLTAALDRAVSKNIYTTSSSWSESTLNYSNKPAATTQVGYLDHLSSSLTVGEVILIPLDPAKLIRDAAGNISIAIDNAGSANTFTFYTKESTNPPQLVINGGGIVPPTMTPVATPTRTPTSTTVPVITPTSSSTMPPGNVNFSPFGTVTIGTTDIKFNVNGTGSNVDSIAFWEAPNYTDSLMFVTSKGNSTAEVYKYPFTQQLKTVSCGTTSNGVLVDQDRDILYITQPNSNNVCAYNLPAVTQNSSLGFVTNSTKNSIEPNLAMLKLPSGQSRIYVSYDTQVRIHDALTRSEIGTFLPSKGLETMYADNYYQKIYIPDENGKSGVYIYNPDGTVGGTTFGAGVFDLDEEGIWVYKCPSTGSSDNGDGLIVVSDQKSDITDFEFFNRRTKQYLGKLNITGVNNTDGISITQQSSAAYPLGLLTVIDNDTSTVGVGWDTILAKTGLSCGI